MTPDEPASSPSPPPNPATPTAPPTLSRPVAAPKRRHPVRWPIIGLIVGLLIGLGGGYWLFNGRSTDITSGPAASPSPSPTAVATPSATATTAQPVQTIAPVAQGVVPCPVATPLGQHQLGKPGPPSQGPPQNSTLDFCGGGSATIPSGITRFTTNNTWRLGIADSCPVGSSGEAGMGTVLTVTEVAVGGGNGADPPVTAGGDWADGVSTLMPTGGSYQLQVTTVSPSCVWQVDIYPS
jgi:hypothetical protein